LGSTGLRTKFGFRVQSVCTWREEREVSAVSQYIGMHVDARTGPVSFGYLHLIIINYRVQRME
jgi:hypothetical protein